LRKKLDDLIKAIKKPNIRLTKWSMKPIWAGPELMFLHLKAMNDLIELKEKNEWDWDYILNLSEADFPIK
jgi:protein xylosyltransferase